MEIGRLVNLERLSGRLPPEEQGAAGKPKKREGGSHEADRGVKPAAERPVFSAPINFEYLPSGKIQLNREIRRQLVDLFE